MSNPLPFCLLLSFSLINSMEHAILKKEPCFRCNTIIVSDNPRINISKAIYKSELLEIEILKEESTLLRKMRKKKPYHKILEHITALRKKLNIKLEKIAAQALYKQLTVMATYKKKLNDRIEKTHNPKKRARLSIKEHKDLLKLYMVMYQETQDLQDFAKQGLTVLEVTNLLAELYPPYEPIRDQSSTFFMEIKNTHQKLIETLTSSIAKLTEHQHILKLKESDPILTMRLSGSS